VVERTNLEDGDEPIARERLAEDVVHARVHVAYDVCRVRVAGHADDRCTRVELADTCRRRKSVQSRHHNVLRELQISQVSVIGSKQNAP